MEKISLDGVEPDVSSDGRLRRAMSDPLGTTTVAINHYRLAPGSGFPGGLHAHMDQEELFVVIDGEATFETMAGEVTVGEGEAIRFAPGEFHSGANRSGRELVAFALGAPRETEDIRIPVDCPTCGHDNLRIAGSDIDPTFVCQNCETEHLPDDCPECGDDELRITLDEDTHTVVVCQDCDAAFDTPPLRND